MDIYTRSNVSAREIYKKVHGAIPKDESGRSFEIHHIDGNHENNDPSNLSAVTIEDHYRLHYEQGDWFACYLIAYQRMNRSPEELSELSRKTQLARVEAGTHPFLKENRKFETEYHHLQHLSTEDRSNHSKARNKKNLENGSHNFLKEYTCTHCDRSGKGPRFKSSHFEKCTANRQKNQQLSV